MYDHGLGVTQDKELAIQCYKLAADQGYSRAQFNLGIMYSSGDGVLVDKATAVKYYRLAAESGYSGAQCNLGYLYHCGDGVETDHSMAFKYYSLAAEQNDPGALFYLGYMYEHGQAVSHNKKMTVKYYVQAKIKGDSNAEAFLAQALLGPSGAEYKRILFEFYEEEWPKSYGMVNEACRKTILELILVVRWVHMEQELFIPLELIMEMCRTLVGVWQFVESSAVPLDA